MVKFIRRTTRVIWRLVNVICFIVGAITILLLLSAKIANTNEAKVVAEATITEEATEEPTKEASFVETKAVS